MTIYAKIAKYSSALLTLLLAYLHDDTFLKSSKEFIN